jgi:hypothetical protein
MKSGIVAFLVALIVCVSAGLRVAGGGAADLPAGWRLEGDELVWVSTAPLRMGAARYEFRSGDRLLGYPVQRGDTLRLRISADTPLTNLAVWAAGRRIDVSAPKLRIAPPAPSAEPAIAESALDPALAGPYETVRLRYRLADLAIPEFPAPVEVLGEVTAPVGDVASLPLVLFLHGRHSTCYRGGPTGPASGDWPCPKGWRAVPSHTGYRYIADVLASQGYLTVSIAANGINGQDGMFMDGGAFARSRLVRHHLAQWAQWSRAGGDPWNGRFRGRVNLEKLVLVGHSRGGEGVERAAIESEVDDPWKIQGLVLIGPTAFGRQVAPGIHTTVILPFCDGDVADLQGQQYVDLGRDLTRDRALRSSVMAMGTNHNFYNTEWTPGLSKSPAWDDWFDPDDAQCGENRERRLSPFEQQAVGLAYTAALVDLAVADDSRARPLLDGTRVKPRSIGRANAIVHAIGGDKQLLFAAGAGTRVSARALTANVCRGYFLAGPFDLRSGCTPRLTFELLPHWSPMAFAETAPAPRALKVEWSAPGGSVRIPVSRETRRADALDFRMAGAPGAPPVEFDVRVRDASGQWAKLTERPLRLRSYFGPSPLGKVVARQLRARLDGAKIDARRITDIELIPRSEGGRFWLLDISTWQRSLADSDQIHLPRVSVEDVVVPEGDSGEITLEVPVTIDRAITKPGRVWVQLSDSANFEQPSTGFPLALEPGMTSAAIPFVYEADDIYDPFPRFVQVTLLAEKNVVTGDFDGSILVEEDDPPPVLTVDSRHVTAAEGSSLTWTFRLSNPLANGAFWSVQFLPTGGRFAELDSDDVPPSYLETFGITPPEPAVRLSELGLFLSVEFAPDTQAVTLSIPIVQDDVSEASEGVVLLLDGFGDPVVPQPIELTGTVTGAGP